MKSIFVILMLFVANTLFVNAQLVISEIMYDPEGTDSGREWIEVENTGTEIISLTKWKFFEANANHSIDEIDSGVKELQAGEFGIILTDKAKFILDFPTFTGKVFKSSFSLINTGEPLSFKNESGTVVTEYSYDVSLGANGNKNSLQKSPSGWIQALPTPGTLNATNTTTLPPDDSGSTTPPPASTPTPVVSGTGTKYVVPKIFGAITLPPIALAGVEAELKGQTFTSDGKLVQNSNYSWNFGDGISKYGDTVKHRYKYPGTYYTSLEISSYVNTSSVSTIEYSPIEVIAPDVSILEAKDEKGSLYTRIENQTEYILEVSGWIIRRDGYNGEHYVLPRNTFIAPNTAVRIPEEVTGFKKGDTLKTVELLFPNAEVAAKFEPVTIPKEVGREEKGTSQSDFKMYVESPNKIEAKPEVKSVPLAKVVEVQKQATSKSDSKREDVPSGPKQEETLVVPSEDKNILTAVAIPQEDTRFILWYTLPLLILVVGAGIFLGSKKEDNQADVYTIVDDDSK